MQPPLAHHNSQTTRWILNHKDSISKTFKGSAQLIDEVLPTNTKIILFTSDNSIKNQVNSYNEKTKKKLKDTCDSIYMPLVNVPWI